ncbi:MAG TPA: hypothetical protein PLK41_04820 [Defluviitoga tunisiensis]|jgi:hypothetical protein|nr:hypothetical protein [Defluviitoga tunisiensis]MDY0379730.1 hypothetical protein [Defluviitoga tunisiensis]HOB55701.1 hypothetical protein [Defluviitoga tunisiensis]HOK16381.1 hypothetical protein [Defluviitoga tunisiensis]HOL86594.1 hypothetical protein [Defluviitoga tunisiensis]
MNKIKKLQDFIAGQDTNIMEFDEALYENKFTVEFKSNVSVDIEDRRIRASCP